MTSDEAADPMMPLVSNVHTRTFAALIWSIAK